MNKLLYFSIFVVFLSNCSFNSNSNFWTKEKKIKEESKNIKIYKINNEKEKLVKEFNTNVKIKLNSKTSNSSFIAKLDNNSGIINYDGGLKKSSKYSFSKIQNFENLEPEFIFHRKGLIFFNSKGTILNFAKNSKLIWKKNIYTKKEKKLNPILFFASNEKTLIVTDSIGKYYALNIENGELLWKNNHSSPFNSQIKIYEDRFFTVDYESRLNCFSIKNGNKIWDVSTEESFIKSVKKIFLIIKNNLVIFNNSIGDISAVNINSGKLVWQTPTQNTNIYADSFKLQISELVSDLNSIYFSNNKNEFYSIDLQTGLLNWKQKVNSNIRPTVVENLIFTISLEGFFVILDKNNGNIIRVTDVFSNFKKRKKINPSGFILGKKLVYLTTTSGKLILIDIESGKVTKILNIDNEKISRPMVLDKNLYITKNNSIIRLN